MKGPNHAPVDVFERFTDAAGQIRYILIGETPPHGKDEPIVPDERWLPILQDSFPDGYILDDFLGQFQAAAFWQERYGEGCPIQGEAIDAAMKAVGAVRDVPGHRPCDSGGCLVFVQGFNAIAIR